MRKVEVIENIKVSPGIIISAFTDAKMLKDWWGVERTLIERKVGGLYILAWNISDKAIGFVSTGIISDYNSENILVIDNFVYLNSDKPFLGPMLLTIKANEKGGITELYLSQEGYQSGNDWNWYYETVKQAWPTVLHALKNYLESNYQ